MEKPVGLTPIASYPLCEYGEVNVFWPYLPYLQNKRDSVTDLKDNGSKGRWKTMATLGKACHNAGLTFHSIPLRESPSIYKDHTLKKAKEKRQRKKHKNMMQCVCGRVLESLFW